MRPGVETSLVRGKITSAAAEIASLLGGSGHCALLARGDGSALEMIHRDGLPPEVCGALGLEGGKRLLRRVRRSGSPLRLRAGQLQETAPDLDWAMEEHGVASIALVPLLGDGWTVGFVCVGLPTGWNEGAEALERRSDVEWRCASCAPGILQLAAGTAALRTILQDRELSAPGGADGVVVLDHEQRVVLVQGFVSRLSQWREGGGFGRFVKGLPGGRAMAAVGEDEPGRLLWKNRTLPGSRGTDILVRMARLPWVDHGTGARYGSICLLQDQGPSGNGNAPTPGGIVLEMGLRVSHSAQLVRGLFGPTSPDEATALVQAALDKAREDENRSPVDVGEILRDLVREYSPLLLDQRIRILPIVASGLPEILGDVHQLKGALRALLESSRRSLRAVGGTLFVRAFEGDGAVVCTLAHDGAGWEGGIGEGSLEMESFPLGAQAQDHEDHFAVVKRVVDRMGGRLALERREDLWTRVTLMFPLLRRRRAPAVAVPEGLPPAVEVRSSGRESLEVLVVDDNDSVRAVLKRCLERRGHLVTEARDGGEALDLVRTKGFDRLMVDVHMPRVTGTAFFDGLGEVAPAMRERTVFMTGGVQEEAVDRYLEKTGRPSLEKPFDLGELIRTLEA
jgi:CheY-like chemotaxis protein